MGNMGMAENEYHEKSLRLGQRKPMHAPEDGVGDESVLHSHVPGHPMGCPVCKVFDDQEAEITRLRQRLETFEAALEHIADGAEGTPSIYAHNILAYNAPDMITKDGEHLCHGFKELDD